MKEKKQQKLLIQPFSDYLFLKTEKIEKSKGGVILSDTHRSKPSIMTVLAVGPGKLDRNGNYIKSLLRFGDKIVIDPFLPQSIKIDGEEYMIARESDIYGKLN